MSGEHVRVKNLLGGVSLIGEAWHMRTHPSLPASQLLFTAVFAALTPHPTPSLPTTSPPPQTPPSCPYAPLLSAVHTYSALSRRHRRRHVGSGFVALARTQLPRTTHLTQPPLHPTLLCCRRSLGVPMDSVCVVARCRTQ